MKTLQNTAVLILGLGHSGLAMARWCARAGARVTVADTRAQPPHLATLRSELPTVQFIPNVFTDQLIVGTDISAVFVSPGLSPTQTAPVLRAAYALSIWVSGELGLFSGALLELAESQNYTPKVLAITGTNGKTTVTALTGQLVARSQKTVAVAGNIGPSLLDTLRVHIDTQTLPQVWVLELSSFQLEGIESFAPTMGTVLNISQDHLDWHGTMQAYCAAKARVFGVYVAAKASKPASMLLNRDDSAVMAMLPTLVKGKKIQEYTTFGADLPQRTGDFGLETVNGMTWLVKALEADETRKGRKEGAQEIHIQRLIPADALRIRGRHNALNALAALALASAAGCTLGPMLYGLREYVGEPHRMQSIATINAVEYFDDSKGTNVGATVAALIGLGAERKLVLILGGDGKGQDFSPLADPVARYVRGVLLIGKDADAIGSALQATGIKIMRAASLQIAVEQAAQQAQEGDAVLMSPACASFDMFENYEHRARVFHQAVNAVAMQAGVVMEELA